MALSFRGTTSGQLIDQVRRWVDSGIVTPVQGDLILRSEHVELGQAAVGEPSGPRGARRLSPVVELVTYLGIILVVASGAVFVSRLWHGMGLGGRLAVGVVVALVGFIGGRAVIQIRDPGTTRLAWFLWLCGTGGVAMTTAVAIDRISGSRAGWTLLATGLAVLVVSVPLWRNLERPLQFLTSVAGAVMAVIGLVLVADLHPSVVLVGLLIWVASVVLAVLGVEVLHPSVLAIVVAELGALESTMAISTSSRAPGIALGLASAAAGVGLGLRLKQSPVVAVGVIGFFTFLVRLLTEYLHGVGTVLGAFVIGVALVSAAIWRATRQGGTTRHHGFRLPHRHGHGGV
jgi:hypothetical protein